MDSKDRSRSGSRNGQRPPTGSRPAPGKRPVSGSRPASGTHRGNKSARTRPASQARPASGRRQTRKRTVSRPRPEVVYTQPEPFNRNRFLLRLATVTAVVLALFFGMSIFFRVETVVVSGASKYTAWEVRQASGIEDGENLLALNEAMIGGKIKTTLPYVSQARVGIKLPGTVNIEIVETDIPYAVEAGDGSWWLMASDGRVLEQVHYADAGDYTKVLGVQLDSPVPGNQAVALEPEPEETTAPPEEDTTGGTVTEPEPVTVFASERLAVALDILQYLEGAGILGDAASVNVTDMGQLEIWYGSRYQILLGDRSRLGYKIDTLKATIDQLGEHYTGVLDVSYTLRPSEVVYTPFG